MIYFDICEEVEKIIKKYDERDPIRLCKEMDIIVLYEAFGTSEDAVKGFFAEFCRIPCITINSDLPFVIQKIIAAHELGHAVLHRNNAVHAFQDVGLFDESSVMEKEANLFAAELLLDDEEVLECLNSDTTFSAAAAMLRIPMELLDFKFRMMKQKGCKVTFPTINARSNFLRDIDIPDNADYT